MRIFQDVFTDDEFISDSYKMEMLFNDVIGEVKSRMVIPNEAKIDIGRGTAFCGSNEQQEELNGYPPFAKVIDLVVAFRYEQTSFDKPGFQAYFKEYVKKLLGHLKEQKPERVTGFMSGAKQFFAWAKNNFDELTFYTGQQYDIENLIVISYYKKEDDEAPTFVYFMDGLKSYKV